ncbi:MAG: MBL fold metallo-hydrolase [Candidatus Beckwithbacteria bacterium]|nr:MBL fold metallo-hydrolase [Candidatus Beckwithbacteria bacterium]
MKKINWILSLAIGAVIFLIGQWPDNQLHLIFCNVGQGDTILMEYQDKQVLVDTGPDNSVLTCLGRNMPFWDRHLEAVMITHNQKDHTGGLAEIKKRYQVSEITGLQVGDELTVGEIKLRLLAGIQGSDKNTEGLVFLGSFGEFDWLLTADITEKEETGLLDKLKEVTVLKVAHHGSKYSSSQEFLETIKPQLAVISVGKNSYGHPTPEVLQRLGDIGAEIRRTDKNGQIVIVSDGRSWYINSDEN